MFGETSNAQKFYKKIKKMRCKQGFYFQNIAKEYRQTPVNYYFIPIENYTASMLSVNRIENSLKIPNQFKSSTDLFLGAEGTFRHNKLLFNGSMSYTKNYLKKLGWNSTQLYPLSDVEKSPFYYLSYQQGDWNNQLYRLSGDISYPIFKNLYVTGKINYNTFHYFRTQDPKPELKYLKLQGAFSIHYKWNKHLFGLSFLKGYRHNGISISYTGSASDINIPFNVDLYNRISLGYGFISSAKSLKAEEREQHFGGLLHYFYGGKEKQWNVLLKYKKSKNTFYENYEEILPEGYYKVKNITASIRNTNFEQRYTAGILLNYQSGGNYRRVALGKNYQASSLFIEANYSFLRKTYEAGAFLQFYQLKREDFSVLNRSSLATMALGGAFKTFIYKNLWWKNKSFYSFKVKKEFSVDTISDKYVKEILIPDVIQRTLPQINSYNTIGYQFKVKKGMIIDVGCLVNMGYYTGLDSKEKKMFGKGKRWGNNLGMFLIMTY